MENINDAIEIIAKVKASREKLDELESKAKTFIQLELKKEGVSSMSVGDVSISVTKRKTYFIKDESVIPEGIVTTKKSIDSKALAKWQNAHATIATPVGVGVEEGEAFVTVKFRAQGK